MLGEGGGGGGGRGGYMLGEWVVYFGVGEGVIHWGRGGEFKSWGVIRWGRDVGYNKCSQDVLLIIVNITSH